MSIYISSFLSSIFCVLFHLSIILDYSFADDGCLTVTSTQRKIVSDVLINHHLFGKKFTYSGKDNYDYDFVICGDVKPDLPNVSLLKRDKVGGVSEPIGYRNETNVTGYFGPGSWAMLTFSYDHNITNNTSTCKKNSSSVMIVCDPNYSTGEFKFLYEDLENCHYVFELRIGVICDTPTGLSGFAILLIILFVLLVVYFIAGIIYNRTKLGAKGIDQIPHRNFWFGIGNAFADGCSVICRCDRCCAEPIEHLDSGSYSGGYSPIGEGTSAGVAPSQSYERDSQLIRP